MKLNNMKATGNHIYVLLDICLHNIVYIENELKWSKI